MNTKTLDPFRKLYMAEKRISSHVRDYFKLNTQLNSLAERPYDDRLPIEAEAFPYNNSDDLMRYLGIDVDRVAGRRSELQELGKLITLALEAGLRPVVLKSTNHSNKTRFHAEFEGGTDRLDINGCVTDEIYTPTTEPFEYVLHRELRRHQNDYHIPDHRNNYSIEQWVPHPVSKFVSLAAVSSGSISYNRDAPVDQVSKLVNEVDALLKKCNYRPIGSSRKRTAHREVKGMIYGCYIESFPGNIQQFTVER